MALSENFIKMTDIIVKGLVGSAIVGLVTYYGYRNQEFQQQADRESKSFQAAIELMSKQKDLDVDLGMRMFGTLMTYYFQKDKPSDNVKSIQQQMLLLRLIALNFQDVPIHIRPLFDELNGHLTTPEQKQKLRSIPMEVGNRQAFRLTIPQGNDPTKNDFGWDSGSRRVRAGDTISCDGLGVKVTIDKIGPDSVEATIASVIISDQPLVSFTVDYFSIPIVDNTKIGDYRYSLMLQKIQGEEAVLRFIAFPKYLATDRFDIKELSRSYRDKPL